MNKKLTLPLLLLASALGCTSALADLTVVSHGGANKDAQVAAFYKSYEAEHGTRIIAGEFNGELAKIKVMVDTASVSWDVVEMELPELARACDEGLLEEFSVDPQLAAQLLPGAAQTCGVGFFVWSTVLAYNADKLQGTPQGWADFWDLKKFPGKRGLRKGAMYTMEFALLADGVPNQEVYQVLGTPEGQDRAFRKLDQIKSSIQWWEAGAQPAQWLIAGDVVMSAAYNGRIASAQKEGMNLGIVWPQSLYDPEYWAVVKGTPNKALAEKFIAFASQPQTQKVFSETIPYGPVHREALGLLPAQVQQQLPTAEANLAKARAVDAEFWVDHGEELEERFNAWAAR